MAVITTNVWEQDDTIVGGVKIVVMPDARAYGLAVSIPSAQTSTVDWTMFYDGTLVVTEDTNTLYHVLHGVLVAISTGGGTVGPPGPQGPPGATGPAGPPGAAGAPGVVQSVVAGANTTVDSTDPAHPIVASSGVNEVYIGPDDPIATYPTIELWFDTDAQGGGTTPTFAYVHTQSVASASWIVIHNLGWYPNVFVEDSSGNDVTGDVTHNSVNQLTLTFSGAFAGVAYLS